jgi:hypothetical protein
MHRILLLSLLLGVGWVLPAIALDPVTAVTDTVADTLHNTLTNDAGEQIEVAVHRTRVTIANQVTRALSAGAGRQGAVVALAGENSVRLWHLERGEQQVVDLTGDTRPLLPQDHGAFLLRRTPDNTVSRISALQPGRGQPFGKVKSVTAITLLPWTKQVAVGDGTGKVRLLGAQGQERGGFDLAAGEAVTSLWAGGDHEHLVVAGGRAGNVAVYDPHEEAIATTFAAFETGTVSQIRSGDSGAPTPLLWLLSDNGDVGAWLLETPVRRLWSRRVGDGDAVCLASDTTREVGVVGLGSGDLLVLDPLSGKALRRFRGHQGRIFWMRLLQGGRLVASVGADAELHIRDVATGAMVLRGVSLTDGGWAVLDADGRFDGSEGAFQAVRWQVGDLALDLNRFSRAYYEPGLLAKYVNDTIPFLTKGHFSVTKGIPLPPVVQKMAFVTDERVAGKAVQVLVAARAIHSTIEGVFLYHNGKRMPVGAVIVDRKQRQEEAGIEIRAVVYNVIPVPGENRFTAAAIGAGNIEGPMRSISDRFEGPLTRSRLRLVSIGVNRYALNRLDLLYAARDARAVAERFEAYGRSFESVQVHSLEDAEATREAILEKLRQAAAAAVETDTLAVFMAGHGICVDDEWYLLPHDIPGVSSDDIVRNGIATTQLREILVGARAQRVLLMVDACQSGQAAALFDSFLQRRIHRELGRTAGITVLAASGAAQQAMELSSLGHGLFTTGLLSGLAGEADRSPVDHLISAWELVDHAKEAIPRLRNQYIRNPFLVQVPVAYRGPSDFMVVDTR